MSRPAIKSVEISPETLPTQAALDTGARTPLRQPAALQSRGAAAGADAAMDEAVPPPAARQPAAGAAEAAPQDGGAASGKKKKVVLGIAGAVALAAAIGFGAEWWFVGRFHVSTDDAYVGADIAQLSARVAGRIDSVPVKANERVLKGTPLVVLEDTDYRLALDQARAKLATQEASVTRIGRQIEAANAAVTQAKAQLDSSNAELERAEADFQRIRTLADRQYNSVASLDTARANRDKAVASVAAAKAGITSAEASVAVLEAQKVEADRTAGELRVAVAKAQWDLDATVVRAPIDGFVGNKNVQVGDYVTAGKRLAAVVPDTAVYVDANFKETQLAGIRPGAQVALKVDAADGRTITGTVVSIAPATGSQFSLLPPENATGNFTKIVQRVPVRIAVPAAVVAQGLLRPGLSVVATVDTRTGGGAPGPDGTAPAAVTVQSSNAQPRDVTR
jgi:membrane fusion protein (multidrug efflux system)